MEKKIKYEVDNEGYCLTKCEHHPLSMIGSARCSFCHYFIQNNGTTQTVTCNHPNNKPDKEGGKDDNR